MVDYNDIYIKFQSNNPEKIIFKKENISNLLVKVDKIFGIRAIGIVFYGALPSYLALVGTLDIEIKQYNDFSSPLVIALVSILPILLTFMLIRNLHKEWYLTTDFLNFRSAFATFMIILLSILVSETSGVIHNKYVFEITNIWNWNECRKPIIESFLIAILSLVLTSTFFLTSFTRSINVPGLSSIEYATSMKTLHKMMKEMKRNEIWSQYTIGNENLTELVGKIEEKIDEISDLQGDYFAKISMSLIQKDITNLKELLTTMGKKTPYSKEYMWKLYFENSNKLNEKEKSERKSETNLKLFESVERLRGLRL